MLVWYLTTRHTKKLRGTMNTVCMQANSTPSLVVQDFSQIPDAFYTARMEISRPEWQEIVSSAPGGVLATGWKEASVSSFRRNYSAEFCLMHWLAVRRSRV